MKTTNPETAQESPLAWVPWGLRTEALKELTHLTGKGLQGPAGAHLSPDESQTKGKPSPEVQTHDCTWRASKPCPTTPTKAHISWGQARDSVVQPAAEKHKSENMPLQKLICMVTSSDPRS